MLCKCFIIHLLRQCQSCHVGQCQCNLNVVSFSYFYSKGDSGGPLVIPGTKTQVGVVSWSHFDCGENDPSVYQRVSVGYNFISGMMSTWAATGKAGKLPRNNGCTDNGGFYHDDVVDAADLDATHNCLWYAQSKHCEWYGDHFAHAGVTANNACCACGGGTRVNAKASKRI